MSANETLCPANILIAQLALSALLCKGAKPFSSLLAVFLLDLSHSPMRVPDNIIECVCFLCIKNVDNGVESYTIGGTAFFVSIPSETDPDIGYVYLVTARHCVDAAKEAGNLYIRVNLKAGGAAYIKGDPFAFETPPDDDASDVAFALAAPPTAHFDYLPVPSDMVM